MEGNGVRGNKPGLDWLVEAGRHFITTRRNSSVGDSSNLHRDDTGSEDFLGGNIVKTVQFPCRGEDGRDIQIL